MPRVLLLGGPNGSGKTTAAPRILRDFLSLRDYVNADVVAQGLSAFDPESVSLDAGRIMLRRIRDLAEQGADFAFETTLASRSFVPFLSSCRDGRGYEVGIVFLWLRSDNLALDRVGLRVATGGHSVPELTIRRRYAAGWRNFLELYRPIADNWEVYDNSLAGPLPVARGGRGRDTEVHDSVLWCRIEEGPANP